VQTEVGAEQHPETGYRSAFDHKTEVARPGYYAVTLAKGNIRAEFTATERAAIHRYTFPAGTHEPHVLIDLAHHIGLGDVLDSAVQVENDHTASGWQRTSGWAKDKTYYFVAEFSRPFANAALYSDGNPLTGGTSARGKNIQAALMLSGSDTAPVVIKVGLSPISVEGARANLKKEMPGFDFEAVEEAAHRAWSEQLGRIAVTDPDVHIKRVFYSALYHCLVCPTVYSDADGTYMGIDRKIHKNPGFQNYTTFSLWDTFRGEHPLLTLVTPERVNDFCRTILAHFEQSPDKSLPVWPLCANETWCMVGNHSVPVLADAWLKGFHGFDAGAAMDAMRTTATATRRGLDQYQALGYIPATHHAHGVSRTLAYACDDGAIAAFAQATGHAQDAAFFAKRAQSYRTLYDPATGFMRGKTQDGRWTPLEPLKVDTDCYTEGDAWQYIWDVMQDMPGLVQLMGGPEKFGARLDAMFAAPPYVYPPSLDVTGFIGQCAQGNEPSNHFTYLYDYAGTPWKTQEKVREAMALYPDAREGLCGNDDCGQISSWFVFSALGFYPVNPFSGVYDIGSPRLARAVLKVGSGKQFVITATDVSDRNKYIQSAKLNDQALNRSWIRHSEIVTGGTLEFQMGPQPNKQWAAVPTTGEGTR